ncbi:hypothetical protein HWV62_12472 [Athelia sp. TMB]|nr:hypothetical protein HWV62_12472 [Athelia sp. TMB]
MASTPTQSSSSQQQWSQHSGPQSQSTYDHRQQSQQQWLPQPSVEDAPLPPPGQGPGQWVWAPAQTTSPRFEQPLQAGPSRQRSTAPLQDEKRETNQRSLHLEKPVPALPPRRSSEWGSSTSASQPPGAYPGSPQEMQWQESFPPQQLMTPPESPTPPPSYPDQEASPLFSPPRPVPAHVTPLSRPMCLPQIASGFDAPFVRAHGPDAEAAGVSEEDWLAFIDALNIAMTASPPLRIVDLVGHVIGFVPNPYTFVASIFLRQSSQAGMHKLQKALTDQLLGHANATFFEPRGLKVRLMKTAAMRSFIGLGDGGRGGPGGLAATIPDAMQNAPASQIPIFGKIAGQFAGRMGDMLNQPQPPAIIQRGPQNGNGLVRGQTIIQKTLRSGMADGPPPQADTVTCHRLNDLAGSIAPVCFDVPPARAPENSIDRLLAMAESSGHLPAVNPNADKGGFKMIMGRAGDTAKNRTKMKGMGINMKDIKSLKKMRKQAVKVGKNAKKESDAAKGQQNAKKGPVRRNGKSDAQEMLATDDLVWVVLFNKEHDNEIRNTQLADNMQDEIYSNQQWQEEIARETQGRPAGPQYRPYQPPARTSTRQILMQK